MSYLRCIVFCVVSDNGSKCGVCYSESLIQWFRRRVLYYVGPTEGLFMHDYLCMGSEMEVLDYWGLTKRPSTTEP